MSGNEAITASTAALRQVEAEVGKVLIGQHDMLRGILIALLCDGHILLEGVPGLAKTTVVTSLAQVIQADFSRIQFTPDLLPADIIGTRIFENGDFTVRKGPIFAQMVLADEINRAPAKVQAALLEAMQERQVTIGEESFPLPHPFLVLATQNPLDQEGTYALPEAQTDRFLMKLVINYPSAQEERVVLDKALATEKAKLEAVLSMEALTEAQKQLDNVFIDDRLKDYIIQLVRATRNPREANITNMDQLIDTGASPRAVIAMALCARANALLDGNAFVTPQDIKSVAPAVLRHRIRPSYEAEAEGLSNDDLVERLLEHVPVP